ncbi:hypothetical protein SAMN04487905_11628 [Actinopolyspora xinjiangensis]|uniref:Uncharacterized protein n=2 Tax=Actinopolyspora xinjiangensis TaxID=405564 RepID=A0A1H0WUX4_9ACTN|nr:hypothetical protein SAMN04487905_11628 [Actinopolyspora xinjiangensis]
MDVARGDVGLSRHLRNSLRIIRDKTNDSEFKEMADEVIAGKRSLREASQSDLFSRVLDSQVEKASMEISSMDSEELDRLARAGENQLSELGKDLSRETASGVQDDEDFDDTDYSNKTWLH